MSKMKRPLRLTATSELSGETFKGQHCIAHGTHEARQTSLLDGLIDRLPTGTLTKMAVKCLAVSCARTIAQASSPRMPHTSPCRNHPLHPSHPFRRPPSSAPPFQLQLRLQGPSYAVSPWMVIFEAKLLLRFHTREKCHDRPMKIPRQAESPSERDQQGQALG